MGSGPDSVPAPAALGPPQWGPSPDPDTARVNGRRRHRHRTALTAVRRHRPRLTSAHLTGLPPPEVPAADGYHDHLPQARAVEGRDPLDTEVFHAVIWAYIAHCRPRTS